MKFHLNLRGGNWTALKVILIILAFLILSFFLDAGILWMICWAFRWTWWSWRVCVGTWLLWLVLSGVFSCTGGKS